MVTPKIGYVKLIVRSIMYSSPKFKG